MNEVIVKNTGKNPFGAECFVDGKKIPLVRSIDFNIEPGEVPVLVLETVGRPDIHIKGDVNFKFEPQNISEACLILSEELKKHGCFYGAFVASVESVLDKDMLYRGHGYFLHSSAEDIVKRISGEK